MIPIINDQIIRRYDGKQWADNQKCVSFPPQQLLCSINPPLKTPRTFLGNFAAIHFSNSGTTTQW